MLSIRLQRTGRKGHAMFRMVVQDSRVTPTSGKVVAGLGSYDPHAKTLTLDKEKVATFIKNGAQPSDRAALLLKNEGVKLPDWVIVEVKKAGVAKNPEKLRKNQPKKAAPVAETEPAEEPTVDTPAEETAETTTVAATEPETTPTESATTPEAEAK